jgi:hypothetical protein
MKIHPFAKIATYLLMLFAIRATASVVVHISANVTNHVKIAITDENDDILDSAVFIKTTTTPSR